MLAPVFCANEPTKHSRNLLQTDDDMVDMVRERDCWLELRWNRE